MKTSSRPAEARDIGDLMVQNETDYLNILSRVFLSRITISLYIVFLDTAHDASPRVTNGQSAETAAVQHPKSYLPLGLEIWASIILMWMASAATVLLIIKARPY